jgi:RNA polymerase sigma factor (sigma-70 family)
VDRAAEAPHTEDLLRELAPQVLGALVRRYGRFDSCEDAVQEALFAASREWPERGLPDDPRSWLIRVASRKVVDQWRSDEARQRRESDQGRTEARSAADDATLDVAATVGPAQDDTLQLLFLCCHPVLSAPSQLALTLRAVGGLSTAEIAAACMVPEATMAQRISRAKQKIREAEVRFEMPAAGDLGARLDVVLHVLYLSFNEGYAASAGADLLRADLTLEAIRLTRVLYRSLPGRGEVEGLLALMLLTEARRPARTRPDGALVPLDEQDRGRWDHEMIAEGVALVTHALGTARLGPYQLQAAIAAVHDEATSADETDWPQILELYGLLERAASNPMVTLNRAVAVAMVHGPSAGLALLDTLEEDGRLRGHHRVDSVRAHLLEMAGDLPEARTSYRLAARRTRNLAEQRHLLDRAARLA